MDDDANALEAAEQNPRREYGTIYGVMRAAGGEAALYMLAQLKTRQEPVALLTGDQRMPDRQANSHLFEGLMRSGAAGRSRTAWDAAFTPATTCPAPAGCCRQRGCLESAEEAPSRSVTAAWVSDRVISYV